MARSSDARPALFQVAAELADPETREREIRALLAAKAEYPRAALNLITLTPEFAQDVPKEIAVYPAWQWLLAVQ